MKVAPYELNGQNYSLAFTGGAMFEVNDAFGSSSALTEQISAQTAEGTAALGKVAAILSKHGELARRYFGYDAGEVLSAEAVVALATPADLQALFSAVVSAIHRGWKREALDESAEFDVGLAELNAKKKTN